MGLGDFTIQFAKERAPMGEPTDSPIEWEQLRSLVTAIALKQNLDADTLQMDTLLGFVYTASETSLGKDEFENYMLSYLV